MIRYKCSTILETHILSAILQDSIIYSGHIEIGDSEVIILVNHPQLHDFSQRSVSNLHISGVEKKYENRKNRSGFLSMLAFFFIGPLRLMIVFSENYKITLDLKEINISLKNTKDMEWDNEIEAYHEIRSTE